MRYLFQKLGQSLQVVHVSPQFVLHVVQFRLPVGQADAQQFVSIVDLGELLPNRRQVLKVKTVLTGAAATESAATTWGDRTLSCIQFSGRW